MLFSKKQIQGKPILYTVKTRFSAPPPPRIIENQWLHRPKIKNYITEGAKK